MYQFEMMNIALPSPSPTYVSTDRSSCSSPSMGSTPPYDLVASCGSRHSLSSDSFESGAQKYLVVQRNGQRIFGPPLDWQGSPPSGSEVFVGKLPRYLMENDLLPLFEQCGTIYQLRLMMDFSGTNRGFAFITFATKDSAFAACQMFNNFEIRPHRRICVVKSIDNCRLFVGKIPRDKTRGDVKAELEKLTEGVVDVVMYPHPTDKSKNRGFAFIEYENHSAATIARRKLIPTRTTMWGNGVAVDWAEPEVEPDPTIMARVKVLYVRNLMMHTTEQTLRYAFESATEYEAVTRVKKMTDFAFVHFATRQQAELAQRKMNGFRLDGAVLEVVMARPPPLTTSSKTKKATMVQFPQDSVSFCVENNVPTANLPVNLFAQRFETSSMFGVSSSQVVNTPVLAIYQPQMIPMYIL